MGRIAPFGRPWHDGIAPAPSPAPVTMQAPAPVPAKTGDCGCGKKKGQRLVDRTPRTPDDTPEPAS